MIEVDSSQLSSSSRKGGSKAVLVDTMLVKELCERRQSGMMLAVSSRVHP